MRVDSILTIAKGELSRSEWEKLFGKLTFTDNDDNEVSSYQYVSGREVVLIPRGAWDMVPSRVHVADLRSRPVMPKLRYTRTLDAPGYEGQIGAVTAMFKHGQGQVIAPPGRGKTEICLAFAAACKTRTLVVVHTQDLFKQWMDRAAEAVPGMPIGQIQGQTCQVEHLTIATAQTLRRHLDDSKLWKKFGAVIVDEAHHAAAETWEWLLNCCPAYYRFGVTASEKRSDGRQRLVRHHIGPVIYKLKFKSQVPMKVVPVQTGFKTKWNGQQYTRIMSELVKDEKRNKLIADLVATEIREGHSVLVLSRQIKHLENMHAALPEELREQAKIVTGKMPRQARTKFIGELRDGSLRCIFGTQIFEEGVDIPILDRIILAFPGTEITALQKVGRGSRKAEGKFECIVFDLVDDLVRVLAKQFLRRKNWYKATDIKVTKWRRYDKEGSKSEDGGQVRRTKGKTKRLGHRLLKVARGRR